MKLQRIVLFLAPLAGVLLTLFLIHSGMAVAPSITAGVAILCALWWMSEAIPIPVTSLVPLAIFPLLDVLTPTQVAEAYGNPLILLLLGGFMLSTAMEGSGAHRHISLVLVHWFGSFSYRRIVFGFMVAAAILSMWISNTATVLMLLPIALAVIQDAREPKLAVPLLLGICYAANIGGLGTPIGTPPNLIFMQVYKQSVGIEITFLQWMTWAMPVVIVFLPLAGWVLTRKLPNQANLELPATPPWSQEQIRVLLVFVLVAIAWITRKEPFGGWSGLFGLKHANDASVALVAVILMFIIPNGKGGRLLSWEQTNRIPWGILLLFAGGICLANAFEVSGLALILADKLALITALPVILMLVFVCFAVTFLTQVTSNTAITTLLMPVLVVVAAAANIEPALLMVPAAMSASCAFMLPVATAPNAIVYGSGAIPIQQMVRYGFIMNMLGIVIISTICYLTFA